jgi:predicted ester cyclase
MSAQDNKAIVSRFYEEVWNEGNMGVADELIAPTFINRCACPGETSDREAFKQRVSRARADFNFRHTIEDFVAEGDTVVVRLTGHGEIRREALGLNLGHKQFTQAGAATWKLNNGQITEYWSDWRGQLKLY